MKFRQFFLESDNLEVGFHNTSPKNFEKIKTEGLKINSEPYHTDVSNDNWIKQAYGIVPIFIALTKDIGTYHKPGDIQLTINIKGLKRAADIGTLMDFGAVIDENGFYFNKRSRVPHFMKELDEIRYFELYKGDMVEDFIKLTKTLAIMENISPDRILGATILG